MKSRLAIVSVAALLLSACASASATSPVRDQSTSVPFTACGTAACTGTIDGAAYEILMPSSWNGTLLLYSHGYRPAQPFPPNFDPVNTAASPVPGWDYGEKALGEALLAKGYALAGSSYSANGWAVEEGVKAGEQLYEFFAANVGKPNRVYVWGDSLGGLITQTLSEKHPEWVSGAAPLCGAVAGLEPNINLALDTAYGVQQLIDPEMQVGSYATYEEAVQAWQSAASLLIEKAKAQDTDAIGKLLTIAAIVDAPGQTRTYDGADVVSRVSGTVESLLTALAYGTVGRFDIDQRYGGSVVGNEGADYASRISEDEITFIDAIGGEGAAMANAAILDAGPRLAADPAAKAAAIERGGNPSGAIKVPTITMHTKADPLVIVQNETFLRDRYQFQQSQGNVNAELVQLYTIAPNEYPEDPGAPYGAGHCNFTDESRIAVIDLLDNWVRNGVYPGPTAIDNATGSDSGYNGIYTPGPWPDPKAVVTE